MDQERSTTSSRATAGRELDAEIAEALWDIDAAGWPVDAKTWKWWVTDENGARGPRLPLFSTDIAAAWEVVEKMRERRLDFYLRFVSSWTAEFDSVRSGANGYADSDTAPEAICIAALRAVDVPSAVDPSRSTPKRSET